MDVKKVSEALAPLRGETTRVVLTPDEHKEFQSEIQEGKVEKSDYLIWTGHMEYLIASGGGKLYLKYGMFEDPDTNEDVQWAWVRMIQNCLEEAGYTVIRPDSVKDCIIVKEA